MEKITLFNAQSNGETKEVTNIDLFEALKKIEADQCDILFVHTDLSAFGLPAKRLRKKELLMRLHNLILSLGVNTVVYPSFTFSYANGESFDINKSSAKAMGALNEYVRKLPESIRSFDPLMSVVAVGESADKFRRVGASCMGENGIFDLLHKSKNVQFLFLGADPTACFTYAHYIEAIEKVPYRFEKWYEGMAIDESGNEHQYKAALHAACKGVYPKAMAAFEQQMIEQNTYKQIICGNAKLTCFKEKDAYVAMKVALKKDINAFLASPFTSEDLIHEVKRHDERIVMVP